MFVMRDIVFNNFVQKPKSKDLVGRGMTSLVYKSPDSENVQVYTISQEKKEYMQRLNYGVFSVGYIKIGKIEYLVYQFEMEYLEPLTKEQKSTVNRFGRIIKANTRFTDNNFRFLEDLYNENLLPEWLEDTLNLAWDVQFDTVFLDYNASQFRQKNGKIFMVDPMINANQLQHIRKVQHARYNVKRGY